MARTSITKKLINRMLVIESLCFLIVVLLSMWILQPKLRAQYINIASTTHQEAVSKINASMETLTAASYFMVSSPQLQEQVQNLKAAPTEHDYARIRLSLNHLASTLPNMLGVYLDFGDGHIISSFANMEIPDAFFVSETYAAMTQTPYSQGFELVAQEGSSYLLYAKNSYIGTKNCTMTMLYDATFLMEEVGSLCEPLFARIALTDHSGAMLYQALGTEVLSDREGITYTGEIYPNLWTFAAQISNTTIDQSYLSLMVVIVGLFLLMFLSTVLLLSPAIRKTIAPLRRMADQMKQVAAGDLKTELPIESDDEIGQVSRQFNQMVCDLNTYIDRLIETESLQQKMKYSLLISQINPHFIYNTMGIISILARNGQSDDIIAINSALIKILQDRLRVEHMQISDTVEQEVETLKQYLLIQRYRYDYHVEVEWDIDPDILQLTMPKNLLQPLVENALFHGLMDEETGLISGKITVRMAAEDDALHLTVRDNGRGIEDSVLQRLHTPQGQVQRGRHIGLRNIVERLAYLYPDQNCLHIRRDNGTIVHITLPMK